MNQRTRGSTPLVVWGVLVALGGIVLYTPLGHGGVGGRLRWLAVAVSLSIGVGLVASGIVAWKRGGLVERQTRVPAGVLVVVGLVGAVGSLPIFRPWQYDGLAGGIRTLAMGGATIGGAALVVAGAKWYRSGNAKAPLVVLAGLCGMGAFYPLDDAGLFRDVHPLLYIAIVAAFVGVPLLGVLYGWPRISSVSSTP